MKKVICALLLGSTIVVAASAIDLDLGVRYGLRTVSDATIKSTYGNKMIIYPFIAVNVWKGLTIGAGYETGYSASGQVGIFQENSTLKVGGFEVFVAYQLQLGGIVPYVSLGYGSYSYSQTIDSPYANQKVDASKSTFIFAGGLKVYPLKALFLAGEIKFVPLTVTPLETAVDLGGMRITIGAGFTFSLAP